MTNHLETPPFLSSIPDCSSSQENLRIWKLGKKKEPFSICSFYKFLIDSGIRSVLHPQYWKIESPNKISLFCWLVNEDKILTLSNLVRKWCNIQNATNNCVMCHKKWETTDHLLLRCEFAKQIRMYFTQIINSRSFSEVCTTWITSIDSRHRTL